MSAEIKYILENYSIYLLIAYIVVKEGWPVFLRISEKLIPARMKEREKKLAALLEREGAAMDLKEREVIAQETIGKNLVIMNDRMSTSERRTELILESLAKTNQSLAILLDRRKFQRDLRGGSST